MTTMQAIRERRSIRKYKAGANVTQEQINLLLEAAMLAPSACNTRPWEFVVIKNREMLDKIANTHPHAKMLASASAAIIVCALPETQEGIARGFYPQDCGAATQNILLAAVEQGLGACWCGVYPKEARIAEFKEMLSIDSTPFCVIAVGMPDEAPAPRGKFEDSKVRYI